MLERGPQDFLIARIVGVFQVVQNTRARKQQVFALFGSLGFHGGELFPSGCNTSGLGGFDLIFNGFAFPTSSHIYPVCHVRMVRRWIHFRTVSI